MEVHSGLEVEKGPEVSDLKKKLNVNRYEIISLISESLVGSRSLSRGQLLEESMGIC